MEFIHAIILGVVQGIAEFLPISSSGHLVIADALLREFGDASMPQESLTMEIALHFGTLLSILVVYRKDLIGFLADRRLILFVIVATIPVGLAGLLLKSQLEEIFREPMLAGCALMVTAAFLVAGRKLQKQGRPLSEMTLGTATLIGLFQAVAILPGISRSGTTIAAGMAGGLDRENAAKFSFLIAIPAIAGATVLQLKDLLTGEEPFSGSLLPVLTGTVVSFVVGVLALRWLIRIVVADRLHYFAIYCVIAGALTVAWQLLK